MFKRALREGFTLVELSFSMVFIGLLSIAIAIIISNTVVAYRRGLLLGQVNSNGMELVDDMRAAVQGSSASSLTTSCMVYDTLAERTKCEDDGGYLLASVTKKGLVSLSQGAGTTAIMPIYGALCTGSYSYIWNSGYFENDEASFDSKANKEWAKLKYLDENGEEQEIGGGLDGEDKPFKLLKVRDNARSVCIAAMDAEMAHYGIPEGGIGNVFDITGFGAMQVELEEMLPSGSGNTLAFYDLSLARPVEDTSGRNMFYYTSFILGTVTSGINIIASGSACVAPGEYAGDVSSYCAINKFNFAAQVNGG